MDKRGALTNFLLCKLGVAFAVVTLIGVATVMLTSFERTTQRGELGAVSECVTDALEEVDGTPGKVWIERRLPVVRQEFGLIIIGNWDETQIVRVVAVGEENVERATVLSTEVNGGEFVLSCENPTGIRLIKDGQISVEVV